MEKDTLKLEDSMCPICMCILVEPVTMPCSHTLCYPCFKQNVEDTSLTCPMCRTRISNWARRASKNKTLINRKLWQDIQRFFPEKVKKRLDGSDDELEETVFHPVINIAQPGEIRQEYEEQLQRLRKQREMERRKELEASEQLIRKLQEEEQRKQQELKERELKDMEMAQELSKQAEEDVERSSRPGTRCTSTSSTHSTTSSRPASTIESFLNRMREAERLREEDRGGKSPKSTSPYPYKCYTPTEKGKKTLTEIAKSPTPRDMSTVEVQSRSSKSFESDSDTNFMSEFDKTLPKPMSVGLMQDTCDLDPLEVKVDPFRCKSTESIDSIADELRHFKPIRSCPLTPPRKLPSGKVIEPPLIRTTPRNLNKNGFTSPVRSLSDIDASSPIMQRRLSELEEERKQNVQKFSKSTSTGKARSGADHSYSGKEENKGIEHNYSANVIDLEDEKETTSSNLVSYPHVNGRDKPVEPFDMYIKSENDPGFDDMPALPKMYIPLEPNLDDINDFDIAPLVEINNISNIKSETEVTAVKKRKRMNNESKSDTLLVKAEVKGPVAKKPRRHPSGKTLTKDDSIPVLSPQRSIRDWIMKGSPCGAVGHHGKLFQAKVQASNSCTDDIDGDAGKLKKSRNKPLDRYFSSKESHKSKGCKRTANETKKSYPLRKRQKRTYDHSDFIWGEWSPKKGKKMSKEKCINHNSDSEGHSCSDDDDHDDDDLDDQNDDNLSVTNSDVSSTADTFKPYVQKHTIHRRTQNVKKSAKQTKAIKAVSKNDSKLKTLKKTKASGRSATNKPLDLKMKISNTNKKQGNCVHNNSVPEVSVFDTINERDMQEYNDRKLAEELAKQFELEAKMHTNFCRMKGSSDEYNFRQKTKVSFS